MRSLSLPSLVALLSLLALSACDGDPSASGPELPAALEALDGEGQRAAAGAELPDPVAVRVLDDDGDPVPGAPVNFVVTSGGGSVSVAAALTGQDGRAQTRWTLGTSAPAAQALEARVAVGSTLLAERFTADAEPGPAAGLAAVGAQTRAGDAGTAVEPLAVRVVDEFGNGVPGAGVSWSVTTGGGALSAVSAQTDAEGVARATWTLGGVLSAPQGARATLGASDAVDFTATARLPADAVVEPLVGDGRTIRVGEGMQVTARVRTAGGVPLQGVPVSFSSAAPEGSFTIRTAVSDGLGRAGTHWTTPTRSGTRAVLARVAGVQDSAAFTVTLTPAAAASLEHAAPNLVTGVGEPAGTLRVRARDRYGNAVPGAQVQWTLAEGKEIPFSPAVSVTGPDGVAATEVRSSTAADVRTIQATSPGVAAPLQLFVTVRPGPLTRLDVTDGPVIVPWDDVMSLSVRGYDAYGNGIYVDAQRAIWDWTPKSGLYFYYWDGPSIVLLTPDQVVAKVTVTVSFGGATDQTDVYVGCTIPWTTPTICPPR